MYSQLLIFFSVAGYLHSIQASPSAKGFGNLSNKRVTPAVNSKVSSGTGFSSNVKKDVLESTENAIRENILKIPELKEALDLQREIASWNFLLSKMNFVEKSLIPEYVLRSKQQLSFRLAELQQSGWTEIDVHNKLLEITWDASACNRAERHATTKISDAMSIFMKNVAKEATASCSVSSEFPALLDVGTGTGIVFDFLMQQGGSKLCHEESVGVDLSNHMLSIAKHAHPRVNFEQIDFLRYRPNMKTFHCVIFNECFHNFLDQKAALAHAISLCNQQHSKIIISHPKGYANTLLQHSHNSILVPSALPNRDQLKVMIDDITASLSTQLPSDTEESQSSMLSSSLSSRTSVTLSKVPDIMSPHYLAVLEISQK